MIAFDSFGESDSSGSGGGTNPFTFTNSAGDFLLGAFYFDSVAGSVSSTGVFYNGIQLTELYNHKTDARLLWVGYLLAPSTGAHNFAVNGTIDTSIYRGACITFSGVNQSTPIGGTASNAWQNSTSTPKSTTVTVTGTTGTVVDFFAGNRVSSGNANAAQTEKMNNTGSWGGGVNHLAGISYEAHTGSNITMTWENLVFDSGAADQEHYVVEILPSLFLPNIQII